MRLPLSWAMCSFLALTACAVAQPGSDRPSASVMQAMVLAVYRPWQLPQPGQQASSMRFSSSGVILPACRLPTPSKDVISVMSFPSSRPGSMGPPVTTMQGMFMRSAAMSMPGTILSQVPSITMPSKRWASVMTSMESAMISRDGSEYCMPSWPMAMPSQMPMTPNSNGTPPASRMPCRIFSASSRRCLWPGTMSFHAFAMPMNGLPMSSSVTPTALRSARCGVLSMPFLTLSLRMSNAPDQLIE